MGTRQSRWLRTSIIALGHDFDSEVAYGSNGQDRNKDGDSHGESDLDGVLGGRRCLHTQKGGCLRLSSEFAFPLVVGGRRAADRLAELRDGSIGPFALGDTFGPNFGGFRGR